MIQELEKDKWLCTISQKKFKAPEFVRKHILNKFGDQVDEVKMDVEFFNNYIRDDKRPSMPLAPPSLTKRGQEEPRQMKRTVEMAGGRREFQVYPTSCVWVYYFHFIPKIECVGLQKIYETTIFLPGPATGKEKHQGTFGERWCSSNTLCQGPKSHCRLQ